MFVIAGITGQTGAATAQALLDKGHTLRAIVRNPAKASNWTAKGVEIVTGDVDDAAVLSKAFAGAQGAYLLAPPDVTSDQPLAHTASIAQAVRAAALAAKLPRMVFLSSEGAHLEQGTGPIKGLYAAERILAGAAPKLTFLRASYFLENWKDFMGLAAAQGILPSMIADLDSKLSMVTTRDIGQAAADLLLEANPPAIVELRSATSVSVREIAEAMGLALGKPVMPVQPPREQWLGILTGAGLSHAMSEQLAELYDGINAGIVRHEGGNEGGHKGGHEGGLDTRLGKTPVAETIGNWVRSLKQAA
jgi:uncharacterized protein YbjT (DUF2867 family)